ncbi:sensor histidine kinase [Amycolatopsis sp. VS8301801F10]|uniref:sensor histidine kinase n=1 Tax=Amycolatopsis sp. VS8301801F10 TaxID=2652442 RepID=UPI0038FC3E6F
MRTERRWASRLPPTVWDSLLPVLLLLNVLTMWAPAELPVAAALTVALALPLAWRRRAPLTVFGAVAAAAFVQWWAGVQLPADVALLVALYTVAANSGKRATLAAVVVAEIGAVLACLRWATDGGFLTPFVALTAMVAAAAALGRNNRTTRAYLEAARERAVAEERARITREMHDIVTHNLSVMVALADAAGYAQPSSGKAAAAMLQVAETGRQALTDMRRSLGVLRADEPDAARHPLPGIAQLESLADQMCAAGLPTELDLHGDHAQLPATAQLTVYRLVQEALTNTLKHTPAGTHAKVRIKCTAETVTVDVTDAGPPTSAITRFGNGITGMRERAAAYRGTVQAGPLPGGGWGVHTCLDLTASA